MTRLAPWLAVLYALPLVPYVGGPVLVLGSSAVYYGLRRQHPDLAATLNRHAWYAVALSLLVTGVVRWW